jgi:hypothetical protein
MMLIFSHINTNYQMLVRSTDLAFNLTKLFSPDRVLDFHSNLLLAIVLYLYFDNFCLYVISRLFLCL